MTCSGNDQAFRETKKVNKKVDAGGVERKGTCDHGYSRPLCVTTSCDMPWEVKRAGDTINGGGGCCGW